MTVLSVPVSIVSGLDIRDQSWRELSSCLEADPNLFNPIGQRELQGYDRCRQTATTFCRDCPVVSSCFAQAVAGREHGVWSGHLFRNGEAEPLLEAAPVARRRAS